MKDVKIKWYIYNGLKETPQIIYDSFNSFMFSENSRVFNKMIKN